MLWGSLGLCRDMACRCRDRGVKRSDWNLGVGVRHAERLAGG